MYKRYRERRRRRHYEDRPRRGFTSLFRSPSTQVLVLLIVALVIYLILQSAGR